MDQQVYFFSEHCMFFEKIKVKSIIPETKWFKHDQAEPIR